MIRVGKMNKKGQALVEFIIILPVIIYIIMFITDMMLIFSYKNHLESDMNETITLYKENKIDELNKITDATLTYEVKDNYVYLTLIKNYKTITPGLSKVLGKPYKIKSERVILSE